MTYYRRMLKDGRTVEVAALTFGRARIVIGDPRQIFYEDGW